MLGYIAHGINDKHFFKSTSDIDIMRQTDLRNHMFSNEPVDFVVLFNNRNIRRKMPGNVILAFREFIMTLPPEKRDRTRLLFHTQPVDGNGTDLLAVLRDCAPEIKAVFSPDRVDTRTMNDIYAISDVAINMSSAEGFGLGTAEALMAEKMIIVNVTGGLQDQCGFRNDSGDYLNPNVDYTANWWSNNDGRFRVHGDWVVPLFPTARSLIGSPPTPYIFEDHCSWEEAARAIRFVYDLTPEERARRGKLGREYMQQEGFSAKTMCDKFITGLDTVLADWKPRQPFTLIKV